MKARMVQNPAKIIMIQKIHRQPSGLIITLSVSGQNKRRMCLKRRDEARHSQSPDDRPEDGAYEHSSRENRRRRPTGDGVPYVDDDAAADRERRAGENAGEETGDEERCHVLCEGLAEVKDDVDCEADTKDDPASEQLGAWAPEERTNHVTAEEDGGDEISDLGAGPELRRDGGTGTAGGRRCESTEDTPTNRSVSCLKKGE